jgi:ubiquinone/menaquinone biosynthesis C-methylase UbiE
VSADAYVAFTRRFFEGWIRLYDLFALPIGFVYEAAIGRARPGRGRRILDVCTGTGEVARRCARLGTDVTAVDLTPAMLARAITKARGLPVRFALMDARHLGFADRTFDVTVVSLALHDMPRRVRPLVLREAARVSREGVVILDYELPVGTLRPLVSRFIESFETPYFRDFVRHGVEDAISAAGLTVTERFRPLPGFFAVRIAVPSRTRSPRPTSTRVDVARPAPPAPAIPPGPLGVAGSPG